MASWGCTAIYLATWGRGRDGDVFSLSARQIEREREKSQSWGRSSERSIFCQTNTYLYIYTLGRLGPFTCFPNCFFVSHCQLYLNLLCSLALFCVHSLCEHHAAVLARRVSLLILLSLIRSTHGRRELGRRLGQVLAQIRTLLCKSSAVNTS